MDELAAQTGRRYGLVDYHGRPRRRARRRRHGLRRSARSRRPSTTLVAAGERVGMLKVRLFQPFPADAAHRRPAADRARRSPSSTGPRSRAPSASRSTRRSSPPSPSTWTRDEPPFARPAAGHRRPLRPLLQGVHAGHGQAGLRRARRRAARSATSRSASTTTSPTSASRSTPSSATRARPARSRRCSSASARTAPSAPTRPRSRSSARAPTSTPRATSSTTPRSPARSTVSHLRFGPEPIRSTYLDRRAPTSSPATSSACSSKRQGPRATPSTARRSCSTAPTARTRSGTTCPRDVQQQLIDKQIDFWVIDAFAVAAEVGHGQPHQHGHAALLLPPLRRAAGRRGDRAHQGVRREDLRQARPGRRRAQLRGHRPLASSASARCTLGPAGDRRTRSRPSCPTDAPDFVRNVTGRAHGRRRRPAARSARFPVDGTFPTGTTKYEKRAIAQEIPIWDPSICIDCGKCAMVCPHAAIRMKVFPAGARSTARPTGFQYQGVQVPRARSTTGSRSRSRPTTAPAAASASTSARPRARPRSRHKSINMEPAAEHRDVERAALGRSSSRSRRSTGPRSPHDTVKGSQVLEPLFEFSGGLRRLRRDALPQARLASSSATG